MSTDGAGRECYAKALGGCSGALSREHYVSNAILKRMETQGKLKVAGIPFGESLEAKVLSASSLTAKFLCQKHNSDLSPVDVAGTNYILSIFDGCTAVRDQTLAADHLVALDGLQVERWFLKYACGLISSGNAILTAGRGQKTPPPDRLLQVLFGQLKFAGDLGLYVTPHGIAETRRRITFDLTPTYRQRTENTHDLTGVELVHSGLSSFLKIVADFPPTPGIDFDKTVYRPDYFEIRRKSYDKKFRIELTWPFAPRDAGVVLEVGEENAAPTPAANS